jgi:predicted metal-binding protein
MKNVDHFINEMSDKSITHKENFLREQNDLAQLARRLGASEVGIVDASQMPVEDHLANVCLEIRCDAYGLSPSCPPHVSGPSGFRELIKKMRYGVVVRIDIPSSVMFSNERGEVMGLLHEIVAAVEQEAVHMGYAASKSFAGGSCKNIFCGEHAECRVLSERGECRNAQTARPSMSGFGINVLKLMQLAGIPVDKSLTPAETGYHEESMSWVAGLVMVG